MAGTLPEFIPLHALGGEHYRRLVASHLPYSSFNYVSLRCYWPQALVAPLEDGVALVLDTPLDSRPFITALTHGAALEHLRQLTSAMGLDATLRLVPECSVRNLPPHLGAEERPDGFDYIVCLDAMLNPESPGMAEKHRLAARCHENHRGLRMVEARLHDATHRKLLLEVDDAWHTARSGNNNGNWSLTWERRAFHRCLDLAATGEIELNTLAALDEAGKPLGFTVNEMLPDGYYMAHFGKTLSGREGLTELLELETARLMASRGFTRMNYQEDHGNPGLRRMKQSWSPCSMLRVYDVAPR